MTILEEYAKVLREIENPIKDKKADIRKYVYNYADLGQVTDLIKKAIEPHGLSLYQKIDVWTENGTLLGHVLSTALTDGKETMVLGSYFLPKSDDPQALGSFITYMRRYQLLAAFGMAPEDDDGQLAKKRATEKPSSQDELKAAHEYIKQAEMKYCAKFEYGDWIEFHKHSVMTRSDYKNDPQTLRRIADELLSEV